MADVREEKIAELRRLQKVQALKDLQNKPEDKTSPGAAAALGATQGLSFGFGDEIAGAAKAGYDTLFGEDKFKDIPDTYRRERDVERNRLAKAEHDQPGAYLGGEVAGSVGSAFIPGTQVLLPAKGAGMWANLGRAAGAGALTGLGSSQADLTKGEVRKAVDDTVIGGAVGGASAGAMNVVGKAASKLSPEMLRQLSYDRAVKATTGQNVSALRKMAGTTLQSAGDVEKAQGQIRRVGKDLMESGAVGFGDTVENIAPRVAEARKSVGAQIGKVGETIDEMMPNAVNTKKIAQEIAEYAQSIPATETGKKLQDRLMNEAASLEAMGGVSFNQAQKIKGQFKFKPQDADSLISNQDATNEINRIISRNMEDTASSLAKTGDAKTAEILKQYGDLKGKYRSMKLGSDAATDRVTKNLSNRYISPSDYGTGLAGGLAASVATGGSAIPAIATTAVVAGANKIARERGSAAAAAGLYKAADLMERSPEFMRQFGSALVDAGKRGPAALAITHQLLLKNPEYKKALDEGEKAQ